MRLFIDVSDTHVCGLNTGIQRVVRYLAQSLSELGIEKGYEVFLLRCDPLDPTRYVELSTREFFSGTQEYAMPVTTESFFASDDIKLMKKIWKVLVRIDFLRILSSSLLHSIKNKIVGVLFRARLRESTTRAVTAHVNFKHGDVLFLPDAFWAYPHTALTLAGKAKEQGAKILLLLNDIFPFSHPEYFESDNKSMFHSMVPKALNLANLVIFPSRYTMDQVKSFFFPDGMQVPITTVNYGVEKSETSMLYEGQERLPNSILMVGTVEPRKNHWIVLKWFLTSRTPGTILTIIGRDGWLNAAVSSALRRETNKKQGLTWIENASDEDLAYEMRRHEIGIMASHAEGLGLPILEYSSHGMKLVLSDIPVFREVAGDAGHYFDRGSVESLDKAIQRARDSSPTRSVPEVSWRDTGLEVLDFIEKNIVH